MLVLATGLGSCYSLVVGVLASHRGGARALVVEHGSRRSQASAVVARGLSASSVTVGRGA